MSRDKDFDDDIDDMEELEDLDDLIEQNERHTASSYSARRRIEELRERQRLRHLLDNDYPDYD